MSPFDLVVLGVLAVSALVGWVRGGVREIVTVSALILSVLAAIFLLRFTRPLVAGFVDPDWAAMPAALILTFIVFYVGVRIAGGQVTKHVQQSAAGPIDRAVGVGFGLLRGLVALGVLHLVFHTVTPADRVPTWMSGAATYPLTAATADGLRVVAREGSGQAERFGPAIQRAVREGAEDAPPERPAAATGEGYDKAERRELDGLVEERAR